MLGEEIVIASCQTIMKKPKICYSKDACKRRDFVSVTKKRRERDKSKVFSTQNITYLSGASSLALAVCVGPITVLQWAIAFFLASTSANISRLNRNTKTPNVEGVKMKKIRTHTTVNNKSSRLSIVYFSFCKFRIKAVNAGKIFY